MASVLVDAAAVMTSKQKPTSLLTSMLGDKRANGAAGQPATSHAHGDSTPPLASSPPAEQLDMVLHTWERAWMGIEHPAMSAMTRAPAGTPASGRGDGLASPEAASTQLAAHANGSASSPHASAVIAVTSHAPVPVPSAGPSSAMPIAGSLGKGTPVGPAPPLPATPTPHHRPLPINGANKSALHAVRAAGGAADSPGEAPPLPDTPTPHHRNVLGAQAPAPGTSHRSTAILHSTVPINVHHPVIPKNAKDSTDFASVFFSPLPYSYLNMARSDSAEHLLVNSVGSPDVTLRGGRLAACSSVTHHVDWPVDSDGNLSPATSCLTSVLSAGGPAVAAAGSLSPGKEDVTTHGHKRPGTPTLGSSLADIASSLGAASASTGDHSTRASTADHSTRGGMGLVQQALARANAEAAGIEASSADFAQKQRNATVSPDSVLDNAAALDSSNPTTAAAADGPAAATDSRPAPTTSTTTTTQSVVAPAVTLITQQVSGITQQIAVVRPPSHANSHANLSNHSNSSNNLLEPSILRSSSGSPRPGSPPFTAHPAVASLVMPDGGPLLPGMDLLQANGVSSIAAAVEARRAAGTGIARNAPLRLVASAAMIPHVDKAEKGGEDAYCIVPIGLGAIGVADGVSGWAEEGIDPAEYSRTLMRFCASALHEAAGNADAREVIRYAHNSTVMPGSSTVCLALMKPGGRLEVANLGDSGVRVVRDGRVMFASAAQQHMFNMPFQLSHPSIIESPDDADSADVSVLAVKPGDVIVLATDGLYDNMFDDEIAQICTDHITRHSRRGCFVPARVTGGGDAPPSPETVASLASAQQEQAQKGQKEFVFDESEAAALAQTIARTAHKYAKDPYQRTPWSVTSCEQGFAWARFFAKGGGKMDDCTVIVAFVQPEPGTAAPAAANGRS